MENMSFCTVINCMDGRVQEPVISYLKKRFGVRYVDCITEAGPNLVLAEGKKPALIDSILERVEISAAVHRSVGIAIAGHYDCAANPAAKEGQIGHLEKAADFIRKQYPDMEIVCLWLGEDWKVVEVSHYVPAGQRQF